MEPRKKVMWLIKGLGAGGAEKLLSTGIPYLNRQAFDYELAYLLPEKNDLVHEFAKSDIPVFCLQADSIFDPRVGYRLVKLLKERQVDILHIHLPYTAVLGRICAQIAGVPAVVYTEHNVQEMYHPVTRFLNRLTYPLNSATITVSDQVQRSALKWKLLQPKRLQTIRGGVDVDAIVARVRSIDSSQVKASLGIPADHLVVGNVAHIRPEKGQGYLIEAAARVLQQYPKTTFVLVGRGKTEGAIRDLETKAVELGVKDRIIFSGFQENVAQFMSIFDVFVLSSLHEGLPIALLEAMASGVPPVATSVGGIPEVIDDGINGFVVEAKRPEALAQKISDLLGDSELRKSMSRKALEKVRGEFAIQGMVEAVEEVFAGVVRPGIYSPKGVS